MAEFKEVLLGMLIVIYGIVFYIVGRTNLLEKFVLKLNNTLVERCGVAAEWIDVRDRLPKKDGRYMVYTENITGFKPLKNNVFIAEFIFNDFVFEGWESNNVTHWMPLPRTPKERGADKPKITCLNCKHFMFSDMYGECNKQLRIVNPSDTCEYAEPKERGGEK